MFFVHDLRASSVSIRHVIGCSRGDWARDGGRSRVCVINQVRKRAAPLSSTTDFSNDTSQVGESVIL